MLDGIAQHAQDEFTRLSHDYTKKGMDGSRCECRVSFIYQSISILGIDVTMSFQSASDNVKRLVSEKNEIDMGIAKRIKEGTEQVRSPSLVNRNQKKKQATDSLIIVFCPQRDSATPVTVTISTILDQFQFPDSILSAAMAQRAQVTISKFFLYFIISYGHHCILTPCQIKHIDPHSVAELLSLQGAVACRYRSLLLPHGDGDDKQANGGCVRIKTRSIY